jgi:hypothetical protein
MKTLILHYVLSLGVLATTQKSVIVAAFLSSPSTRSSSTRSSSRKYTALHDKASSDMERMEMVRSLQKSFYSSSSSSENDESESSLPSTRPKLDTSTGILTHLPLWRVGWSEVPGRASCLNVHEGHYTNMFETILNSGPKPWYFGHLHLPGGTKSLQTGERAYDLKSWREEAEDKQIDRDGQDDDPLLEQEHDRSAVIGSLMRITDYRRMEDGRLCILVHVLERFVVDTVVQSFPYGVAHVQILPDSEELRTTMEDENFAKIARGAAVAKSFQYHDYEFANTPLPLPTQDDEEHMYMSDEEMRPSEIAKVLPFAFYSEDASSLPDIDIEEEEEIEESSTLSSSSGFSGGRPTVEAQLQGWSLLRDPPALVESSSNSKTAAAELNVDALETFLWLAMEELCRVSGLVLPDEIFCLLPPHMDYLDFGDLRATLTPKQPVLSAKYPALRRQKRLSYAVPALLESISVGAGMRQAWLNTPSIRARLQAVLERVRYVNDAMVGDAIGEFE